MKKSTLALSALTLALAAGLSACGGGSSTYTIGGVVTGLEYPGLVLSNNGEDLALGPAGYETLSGSTVPTPKDVTYAFKNKVDYGDPYDVTIKAFPAHQQCGQSGGTTDTAGRLSVINAVITCVLVSNTIGGPVTGLTGEGLVLINGSTGGIGGKLPVAKGATSFAFEQPVTYGRTFGVTVLEQPAGQTCTVTNGAGTMGDVKVDTIAVTCRDNG
ncbi:hypothetical protein [Massilia sp. GCM10023247]|uniref:hypothetical protein n=1 Tax=Massilia sp. GCM10023247 TaxID=3252643 RepID=UPI00361CBF4E